MKMVIFMSMKTVSIAELKAQAPRILREVESGETYTITRRNRPVGRVVHCEKPLENRTRLNFDPKVKILGSVTEPVLEAAEWGDLYPE